MTFYNISKITKDLIWVNYVKNIGINELVFIIDGNNETQGKVVAITKLKIIIKPFEKSNFSNETKILFVGDTNHISVPTNIFGRIFDGNLEPIDSIQNITALNYKNEIAAKLNPTYLAKPCEIIFDKQIQIFNGGYYELSSEQANQFLKEIDIKNKFLVLCCIDDDIKIELNLSQNSEYGEPTQLRPKADKNEIVSSITNSFAVCEYITLDLNINTILIVQGFAKYLQTRITEDEENVRLIPNYKKITEHEIRSELKRNLFLKNEKVGLTVILV